MPGTASGVRTGIKSNKKLRWDRGATKQRYRLEYIQATMSTCDNPSFGSTATRWCTLISGTQMLLLEATDNQPTSWLIVILRVLCSSSTKRYPPQPDFVEMGRELTVGCHREQGNVRITVFSCSDISNPYSLSLWDNPSTNPTPLENTIECLFCYSSLPVFPTTQQSAWLWPGIYHGPF